MNSNQEETNDLFDEQVKRDHKAKGSKTAIFDNGQPDETKD